MKKFDWEIHNVVDNPISFHTHGLDKYDSLEIEIVLPLHLKEGASFCNCIGAAIAEGLKIEDGLMVEGLFNLPIYFFKTMPIHGDKEVFRAIFPDENGFFPWEEENGVKCSKGYIDQIQFTEDKVFYIRCDDKSRVEEMGNDFGSPFYSFEKRNDVYIRPAQYYIAGENKGLILCSPYCNSGLSGMLDLVNTLKNSYNTSKVSIVCKNVDYSDPIHKPLKEYKGC